MCGFIAQLVEHRTGIAEVTGSNPVEALIFFRLLLSKCLNWKFTAMIILHFNLGSVGDCSLQLLARKKQQPIKTGLNNFSGRLSDPSRADLILYTGNLGTSGFFLAQAAGCFGLTAD